ncbi:ribonuclease Z [Spirosoma utsteinense]|uniref:Ribonuclease Z n=2 Tax=Spirosoma utsteinense TaxID=2585773 RepID=A0ABR6WD85_9BACT|nr:ribonuclease Z [Spirosoma utsteinense]MBC3785309.1 ribonuclease Z [Spirosoma utsteinense]MBC3793887.1 ribonuclease Z [Spirosoma utsteinense]
MTNTTQEAASAATKPDNTIYPNTEHHRSASQPFAITILGAGSATPSLQMHPTAQLLTVGSDYMLIDCGEGTQLRLIEQKIRPGRLRYIFISHLHGDHYFGLAPLLSTLNLSGRTEDLYLFGPRGLDEVLTTIFRVSDSRLGYRLHFQAVDPAMSSVLLDHPQITVESIPLQHRIDCSGYLFREKTHKPHLLREKLPADVPVQYLKQLKDGQDIPDETGGVLYAAADYTVPGPPPRSYAFCSDTRYVTELVPQLQGVDLLYHEATFLEDNAERAAEVYHSTAQQAAAIAADAGVGRLLIGHFSSRYKQYDLFLDEARKVFPETYLAEEGETFVI